ncbi:bifunctional 5,10-methylenetetrahydrofolate dehydrogenase/5,10-methenyltetrahydrofolate cyclohydrolase [Acidisphaera sp. L21]|uniref:bifunctional 5,10-methylenetetrahydrofolate dehydrogenase/5,10-methenyltetrahydrofolate cyclohydrolase n=1 Tax=Acidisphaera sp. L21 TaxID=1641851 RepID=UPI00131BDE18|nr:tetrahydrofolate dehydrogenase/cyclohydrolase catalytic domain-containing protein [Acidisphaera sp. L21]
MTAQPIDGKAPAALLRGRVAARVATLAFQPGLAVVLVGDDPASAVYVRNKDKAAQAAGLAVQTIRLPANSTQAEILAVVAGLNADPAVDGILVQLPLPPQLDADAVIATLDPAKDVDGLTTQNAGRLASGAAVLSLDAPGGTALAPCTPRGVMVLLASVQPSLSGARVIVIGRSALVGRPVAQMLTAADATVTITHSRTRDLPAECRRADIVVAAVGRPEMVRGDWLAPGAVVIDVGINRLADGRLVGDAAYDECAAVASAITPVPGGVGPMTIACLLENTVAASIARR